MYFDHFASAIVYRSLFDNVVNEFHHKDPVASAIVYRSLFDNVVNEFHHKDPEEERTTRSFVKRRWSAKEEGERAIRSFVEQWWSFVAVVACGSTSRHQGDLSREGRKRRGGRALWWRGFAAAVKLRGPHEALSSDDGLQRRRGRGPYEALSSSGGALWRWSLVGAHQGIKEI
ncbi:uncharacterized protein A4U43_C04F32450 [Asparagus officinalis]|uniref:Uncharacterized protein n=1 Tax=Asparagus officinalis TaxID=4686 RepID=A0A5P1F7Z6_ASPOF|nr:uncharacterized protein A4U43_C04F32450 [Asparagus officinalis]